MLPISLTFLLFFLFSSLRPTFSTYTIITSSYPPFSDCTTYTSTSQSVFGAEINLLRSTFSYMNWTEGIDYTFECIPSNMTRQDRLNENLDTDLAVIGGVTIAYVRMQGGYLFSQPTTTSSLALIYDNKPKGWFFIRSLNLETWLSVIGTIILVGLVHFYLENGSIDYINMLYNSLCNFFKSPDLPLMNLTSKIVQYFSIFQITIIVIIFTAVSTNIFYDDKYFGGITSANDINDKHILVDSIYMDALSQYGAIPITIRSDSKASMTSLPLNLGDSDIEYMALDLPYAEYLASYHCELEIALQEIEPIQYGLMYRNQIPRDVIVNINLAIMNVTAQKSFDDYVTEYYRENHIVANCDGSAIDSKDKVSLYDTRGLWYIYFVGIGMGTGFYILTLIKARVKKTMRVYDLRGVRARKDKKLQRRVATVTAMHAAVSLQSTIFLKKLNQEMLEKWLGSLQANMSGHYVNRVHVKMGVASAILAESHVDLDTKRKGSGAIEKFKGRRGGRTTSVISNLFNNMKRKTSAIGSLLGLGNESPDEKSPGLVDKSTLSPPKNKFVRQSSMLAASMKSFNLQKKLQKKLTVIAQKTEEHNSEANKEARMQEIRQYLGKLLPEEEVVGLKGDTEKVDYKPSIIERCFGKRGLKRDKHTNMAANNLLNRKQSMLIKEFKKKRSDIESRANLELSNNIVSSLSRIGEAREIQRSVSGNTKTYSKTAVTMNALEPLPSYTLIPRNLEVKRATSDLPMLNYSKENNGLMNRRRDMRIGKFTKNVSFTEVPHISISVNGNDGPEEDFISRWQDEESPYQRGSSRNFGDYLFSAKTLKHLGTLGKSLGNAGEELSFGRSVNESNMENMKEEKSFTEARDAGSIAVVPYRSMSLIRSPTQIRPNTRYLDE